MKIQILQALVSLKMCVFVLCPSGHYHYLAQIQADIHTFVWQVSPA